MSGGSRTYVRRALLLMGASAALLFGAAGPAAAHDHLTSMVPAVDSSIDTLPATVHLMFDDAVATVGANLVVVSPSGATISEGKPTVGDNMISVPIKSGTPSANGTYAVRYRIISVDGHEVHGDLAFRVGVGGPVAPAASATSQAGSGHALLYAALGVLGVVLVAALLLAATRRRTPMADGRALGDEDD